ncbi:transposase [Arsenophonus endosymbiont of Bemisia tabaci]|nr:transposase [Arsenophonus endosymbiont of Bemisia tabaci]
MLSDYLISILTAMFFYAWLIQVLIPVLPKNSVIMMDNATFHKKQSIQ